MIPFASQAIKDLSQKILTEVLPNLSSSYGASDTGMMAMLLLALADEAESGIARRLADISEMAALLQQGGEKVDVPDLIANPKALTLTAVNEVHDACTKALIALHTRIEASETDVKLYQQIWDYLSTTHGRHALNI